MSAERYKIQRLDQGTELITRNPSSNVEPFPIKKWNEPLPIGVEGRPLPNPAEEKPDAKSLTRFYPPLLFFSTALTAVFFYLYLTKPVIVEGTATMTAVPVTQEAGAMELAKTNPAPVEKEELSPWPEEAEALISDALPGLKPLGRDIAQSSEMVPTTLGVEQIIEVASLNGELEKVSVSLPVLYPENVLAWNQESIAEAQLLAGDIEAHLKQVRAVQMNGVALLESWNRLVSKSAPKSVLPENQAAITNP